MGGAGRLFCAPVVAGIVAVWDLACIPLFRVDIPDFVLADPMRRLIADFVGIVLPRWDIDAGAVVGVAAF